MGTWPTISGQNIRAVGQDASTSAVTVSSSGSANTKGSYAELVASTPYDARAILLSYYHQTGSAAGHLLDLAVGAAASEQVIVPNIPHGGLFFSVGPAAFPVSTTILLPISVPKGSRIAARLQSSSGSNGFLVAASLVAADSIAIPSLSLCRAYGMNVGTSLPNNVDSGGSANTKGAWVELSAALEYATRYMILFAIHTNTAVPAAPNSYYVDLGLGAAAAEAVVVPDLFRRENGNLVNQTANYPLPVNLAKGVRIAARAQSSTTDAQDRLTGVGVLAFS